MKGEGRWGRGKDAFYSIRDKGRREIGKRKENEKGVVKRRKSEGDREKEYMERGREKRGEGCVFRGAGRGGSVVNPPDC